MLVDVTDRVQMETALREARDELEERVETRTAELEQANEQLRRQTKRLEALRDVDRAILSAESPHEIATVAAQRAQDIVPCERVSVALFDWEAERVTVLTAQQGDDSVLEGGTDFPLDEFTLTDRLRAGRVEDMPNFDAVPSTAITDRLRRAGIRSVLTVPMHVEDELIGTVNLGATEPHAFTEEERRIGQELSDHLAIALRQSRLLEAVQAQREQLATLRDIDQAILAAESPEEIATEALRRVRGIVPFESATVSVIDWDAGMARLVAALDNVLETPTTLPLDEVYLSEGLRAGETEVISVEAYEPVPEAEARIREMGLRSVLCLPMVVEEEVIGIIHVGRTEPDAFTEDDWQVGRELADHMAIALRQSQLLEEVQAQRERLEERVRERTEELESFTYSVSHDLRTPLRAIDGYTRILKEEHADQLDEEGRRLLDTVYESTQTMGTLIDDLLTLSRLGRREMHRVSIDVAALAQEAFDELTRAQPALAEDVTFTCEALPKALGDRSMIRQVLINLLSNALKFTQQEEAPHVEVGAEDRGDEIVYFVRDNGVGFSMEYADKLFGVFERLHDEDAFEGTGVGLALVERIVRRHDGTVWGKGTEGKGATIFFTLPPPDETAD
jgi:K+-sensing histidine kinase KdpD